MLTVERMDDYLRVTYSDGSDWIFRPPSPPERGYGAAEPAHVWCCDRGGTLQILHAPTRRPSATIQLDDMEASAAPVSSRDGRKLYALTRAGASESALTVVDIAAGQVTALHSGLPWYRRSQPVERKDGRLLLAELGPSLILIDPATGERQNSRVAGDEGSREIFLGGSPDGRFWIRFDQTTFPTRETAPSLVERILGTRKGERLYGLTLQIWEAFPLRFVRRVVVAWLKLEELPDEAGLRNPAARRAIWDAFAAATSGTAAEPHGAAPPRSAYGPAFATDEKRWSAVERNVAALGRWAQVQGWQPDGEAFWVSTNGFLSCVGVDGAVSPRLYTQRLGLRADSWLPAAAVYKEVVPLAGRQARVIYREGEALFDGAPSGAPYETHAIPTGRDHWQVRRADDLATRDKKAARLLAEALEDERVTIVVPLGGRTEAAGLAAIEALTARVGARDVHDRARPGHPIRIVFALPDGERLGESRFFSEVAARIPGAAPAIRRLLDRYMDLSEVNGPNSVYYGLHVNPDDGAELLVRAVQALGVLDRSALPVLKRYGQLIDAEHQGQVFTRETVPAVIAAHGWTDDVVDFVFWVLIRNYYNTLQDYGMVWREWGLRDAVVHREPRSFARHLTSELADVIARDDDPGRYGPWGLQKLAEQIPQPHEPWAAAFFAELERIASERAGERA